MAKKVTARKTIFKIACATGGAVLASGVGLPWLGAMAGACLPKVLEGSLDFLVSAVEDDKKQEVLAGLLQKPLEQLASLGIEFTGGRIDDFFKSHFESKESELNFDLPRVVLKVWEEALNKMLRKKRDTSILGLNRDDGFEKARKELLTFWKQKLHKAQSDNDLLQEFFGEKPDYFLEIEKGKVSFIDVLPDQEQVEKFFWERIEDSFTNWAKNEEKFPEDWQNSIPPEFKDELKQNLFHNFSSALKKELKENERAWKSFEFASSLQTVSMLQSLTSNIDQIKDDTGNIKKDLAELNTVLPLMRDKVEELFNTLEDSVREVLTSNHFIIELLNAIGVVLKQIQSDLREVAKTTKDTGKDVKDIKKLLGVKEEVELPKIPDEIQALIDEGLSLQHSGKYEKAKDILEKAEELANSQNNIVARTETKRLLAWILNEQDNNAVAAIDILQECLRELRDLKAEKRIPLFLNNLAAIEMGRGNLDRAKAYLSESLEIEKKQNWKQGIALTLQQMGGIEDAHGNFKEALDLYDQSLTYLLSLYQAKHTDKTVNEIMAVSYHHKGLTYDHLGNPQDAEKNYKEAIKHFRLIDSKPRVSIVLFFLAKLKLLESQTDEGLTLLDEAIKIAEEVGDKRHLAKCIELKARLYNEFQQTDENISALKEALSIAEKADDFEKQATYLRMLGWAYLKDKNQIEKAIDYFERTRKLSLQNGFLKGYAESVESLANVAQLENNQGERDRLLLEGIQTLEKLLPTIQAEPTRAFITARIGALYQSMENFQQAVVYYQLGKKLFEAISDIRGIAVCLEAIAHAKEALGKKREAYDTHCDLKKLLEGTTNYELIACTAINLGGLNLEMGNLDEAKMFFQEAEFLCQKHNLRQKKDLKFAFQQLNQFISIRKPQELSFEQLVDELFELIDWFPEAKDSLLRLWLTARREALAGNFRSLSGIKLMLCQDSVNEFLKISQGFRTYADLCLLTVTAKADNPWVDYAPFPKDREFFFDIVIPHVSAVENEDGSTTYTILYEGGEPDSEFQLTSEIAHSKITGNEGRVIMIQPRDIHSQAHELILSSSATELIKQKIFYLPYPRYVFNDKLLNDLSFWGKEFGLIPIYFDALPNSDNIEALHSAKINLPILSAKHVQNQRRQIRKVKQTLNELVSNKTSRQSALNDFVFEVEELKDSCESNESIQIQVYVLEFPSGLEKETHIAFVIKD